MKNITREVFEEWILGQFGNSGKVMLRGFDDEDGYSDSIINAMWLGFNAGIELYDLV